MRLLNKEEHLKTIKAFLKYRLKLNGHDLKSFSEKWFNDKVEEMYQKGNVETGEYIYALESDKKEQPHEP